MRRFWMMLLTISVVLAIALPAGAAKQPKAAAIAAYVQAEPVWVHEAGDVITYNVNVENRSRTTHIDVVVTFDFDNDTKTLSLEGGETDAATFSRTVAAGDFDSDEITGTFTVTYGTGGDQSVVVETSTVAEKYEPCAIASGGGTATVTAGEACIWKPGVPGSTSWEISVSPAERVKQRSMAVTMRDHVPGNWCTTDGSHGGASVRWGPQDDPPDLVLDALLPANGICLGGGAGGAEMPIGNPDSFYLWLLHDGHVTISQILQPTG